MSSAVAAWPMVALGEVLRLRKAFIQIDDLAEYKRCRVQLHAQGVVQRDVVVGAEVKTKAQQVCQAGDFLVAEIDAKVGGFGIVPDALEGAIVSSHYFLFVVDETRLDRRFLDYFVRTPAFFEQVQAQGSTNYAAVRPADVLGYQIPLPPLEEQRRIVGRIEALAGRIAQARGLRREAMEDAEALILSAAEKAYAFQNHWRILPVSELCDSPQYGYTESAALDRVGPRFLRITDIQDGKVNWASVPYCQCAEPQSYLLRPNDLLFARTGATTGKSFLIDTCPEPAVFASYLIRLRARELVTPGYLYGYFQTPSYWRQVSDGATGTGQANVNGKKLAGILVPVPPILEQRRVVAYLDSVQARVEALKRLQAETAAELEVLLPAVLDRAFRGEL